MKSALLDVKARSFAKVTTRLIQFERKKSNTKFSWWNYVERHEFQVSEEYPKIILKCIQEQKLDGTGS
jgi:hypothetical protein